MQIVTKNMIFVSSATGSNFEKITLTSRNVTFDKAIHIGK